MTKYNGFGKNVWKIKSIKCAVMLAVVTVIGTMLYFGYKIVQPVKSQAAMPFDEENAESARILMSVTAREGLNVRTKPSTEGDIILVLKHEEKVEVLSTSSDQWVYIRCIERNGEEGYASSKYLTQAEGYDIGAGVDAGTVTDDLISEEIEEIKKDKNESAGQQVGIEDWIVKNGNKLAMAGVIVILLVSLAIFVSSRSSSGSTTASSKKTYSSGNMVGKWSCSCGRVNADYVGTCGCGWNKSEKTYSGRNIYSGKNSYSGSEYQSSHKRPVVVDLDRVAARAQEMYAASLRGEYPGFGDWALSRQKSLRGAYHSSLESPKQERTFTQGGPTGCGIGGSFCGCGSGR